MNIKITKKKLKSLTDPELRNLLVLVKDELAERPEYLNNTENTPMEQHEAFGRMFSQAWIHG